MEPPIIHGEEYPIPRIERLGKIKELTLSSVTPYLTVRDEEERYETHWFDKERGEIRIKGRHKVVITRHGEDWFASIRSKNYFSCQIDKSVVVCEEIP